MLSKTKGNIAEAKAIAYFIESGHDIFIPLGSPKNVDFIAMRNDKIYRVQVKYAGYNPTRDRCIATLKVMGGNQSYYTAKKYSDDAFDYLFIFTAKKEGYLIPWKKLTIRSILYIDSPIYIKYKVVTQG
jgi:hypothetical protein